MINYKFNQLHVFHKMLTSASLGILLIVLLRSFLYDQMIKKKPFLDQKAVDLLTFIFEGKVE